jgi:hypothetical protein
MDKEYLDRTLKNKSELKTKRTVAKYGMAISMGSLLFTGLMGGKKLNLIHVCSGLALIGFSCWHSNLYKTTKNKR